MPRLQGTNQHAAYHDAIEHQFPWASEKNVVKATEIVAYRMDSQNFSFGYTKELREDAQRLGEDLAHIVGPPPQISMAVMRGPRLTHLIGFIWLRFRSLWPVRRVHGSHNVGTYR